MVRYHLSIFVFLFLLSSCTQVGLGPSSSPGGEEQTPLPGDTPTSTQTMVSGESQLPTKAVEEEISLPPPVLEGKLTLEEVLKARRSIRSFKEKELTLEQVGQLLWAAQGITSPDGKRAAPSAGALYPLEVYYFCSQFWGRYDPEEHSLEILGREDRREEIAKASLNQSWIAQAPGIFVIVGFVERTAVKYGERAERYVTLEAGHACQNLLLEAVALGLGGTSVGAFWDDQIKAILEIEALPLYVVPVGYPRD
ncbi:MAG: SagB/ThcOx family dehydrogenase [Caldiserica bacterium]|jgi:SagB-type dehydrogenase family enzyme|nr:SagB/ThcOx family dehydrogenase [Caldisericota bacterium]MDH7562666.1 SagB/ThcOx family dehydrogenase [Caldisericota bacterium]